MMNLRFSILIQAPKERVWSALFEDRTYRIWTAPFCEGSYFEGTWAQGERIRFLTPDKDGMVSLVAQCRPGEFLSLQHLGSIVKGVEDTQSEQARTWVSGFENYTLVPVGDGTEVRIDQDIPPQYEQFMRDAWPKALAALKGVCEEGKAGA